MKKLYCFGLLTILFLALAGCSSGGDGGVAVYVPRPVYEAEIISDQPSDGNIIYDSVLALYTIIPAPATLFFGIDSLDPNRPEYRAFLDFPLDGSTGAPVIPASAIINSAILEVFVNEVSFAAQVPTLIDLVSYPLGGLGANDYSSFPLKTQNVNFFPSDQGAIVAIDVTQLMWEAQRLGLSDLQLRFVLDLAVDNGFVGIDDHPNVSLTAPLLRVSYE